MNGSLKKETIAFVLLNGYCPPAMLRTKKEHFFINSFVSRLKIKFLKLGLVLDDDLENYFRKNPVEGICFFESCAEQLGIPIVSEWNDRILNSNESEREAYDDAIEKWKQTGFFDLRENPLNLEISYRLKRIRLINEQEFKQKIKEIFERRTYVNSFERRACGWFIDNYTSQTVLSVVPENIFRGELRPIVAYHMWKNGYDLKEIKKRIEHAEDLLRMAIYCSQKESGEISLSKRLPFSLKKKEKKIILRLLEEKNFPLTQYYRKRHVWKVFFRHIWSDAEHEFKKIRQTTKALKNGEVVSSKTKLIVRSSANDLNELMINLSKTPPEAFISLAKRLIKAKGADFFEKIRWALLSSIAKLSSLKIIKLLSSLKSEKRIFFRINAKGKRKRKIFFVEKSDIAMDDSVKAEIIAFARNELKKRFSMVFGNKKILAPDEARKVFYCLNFIESLTRDNFCFVEKIKLKKSNYFGFFFKTKDEKFSASAIFSNGIDEIEINEKHPSFLNAGKIETIRTKDERFIRILVDFYWCQKMKIKKIYFLAKDWRNGFYFAFKESELVKEIVFQDFLNDLEWFFEKKELKNACYLMVFDFERKELTFIKGIQKYDAPIKTLNKFLSLNFDLISVFEFINLFSDGARISKNLKEKGNQNVDFREISRTILIKLTKES